MAVNTSVSDEEDVVYTAYITLKKRQADLRLAVWVEGVSHLCEEEVNP